MTARTGPISRLLSLNTGANRLGGPLLEAGLKTAKWALCFGAFLAVGIAGWAGLIRNYGDASVPSVASMRGTILPARVVANLFVVPALGADGEKRHYVIDTGSTISLVSADFAERYAHPEPAHNYVNVFAPGTGAMQKPRVTVGRLKLGENTFTDVPAVVMELSELSHYLGMKIDGVIGFGVFRNHVLTLDYQRQELMISESRSRSSRLAREMTVPMRPHYGVPVVSLQIDGSVHEVLVDTGSDGGLTLNPETAPLHLVGPAKPGAVVATVTGYRRQYLGRITNEISVGGTTLRAPVVDLMLGANAVGGELLKHYALTFDQRRNEITFSRRTRGELELNARRTVGLSFVRTAGSWEVVGIVPQTPTTELPLKTGDRCVSINGEPVELWPAERYTALLERADHITFTFVRGELLTEVQIPVVSLL